MWHQYLPHTLISLYEQSKLANLPWFKDPFSMDILFLVYLATFGIALAIVEIEIEGKYGWAVKGSTWRQFDIFSKTIFGGRPTTGYHLAIHFVIHTNLIMVNLLYGMIRDFTSFNDHFSFWLGKWMFSSLSCFLLLGIFWDYWWFVLNPYYTWRGHNRDDVPWHPRWLGKWVNADHFFGVIGMCVLVVIGKNIIGDEYANWLSVQLAGCGAATIFLLLVAPLFIKLKRHMGEGGPMLPDTTVARIYMKKWKLSDKPIKME